jgi:hypothetical protein
MKRLSVLQGSAGRDCRAALRSQRWRWVAGVALLLVALGGVAAVQAAPRKQPPGPQLLGTFYGGFSQSRGDSSSLTLHVISQQGTRIYAALDIVGYQNEIPLMGRIAKSGQITFTGKKNDTGVVVKVKMICGCEVDEARGVGTFSGSIAITGTHSAAGTFSVTGILIHP